MDWAQVLFLFFGNIGVTVALIGWLRADIQAGREEMQAFRNETKDFHGRLCVLEERYLNWVMREK